MSVTIAVSAFSTGNEIQLCILFDVCFDNSFAAITAAILSALEKIPLRQDYAVTGEISLSGDIKPVGGVSEKAFGARQAGMKGILIPEDNRTDIDPKTLGIEVIPVSHISEVLEKMLVK